MNKRLIPGVIIVEGTHDKSKVSLIYDSCFVITNGYEIPQKEIAFLKALNDKTQIIVLTDNDEAGETIRARLNEIRKEMINIVIKAKENSKKQGIAECDIESIKGALDKYSTDNIDDDIDLYKLGLTGQENSKKIREYLCDEFNLGICSLKDMKKRIKLLGITYEELKRKIEDEFGR